MKYLTLPCLLLPGFPSAVSIPRHEAQWPCLTKHIKQHRKELLHKLGLALPPHKASYISSGNHRTQLLVEVCFHTMGTGLWRGSEVVFPSLQHPLAYCPTCKSQCEADRGVLSEAPLARSRHGTTGTIVAMVREIIYRLHCTRENTHNSVNCCNRHLRGDQRCPMLKHAALLLASGICGF